MFAHTGLTSRTDFAFRVRCCHGWCASTQWFQMTKNPPKISSLKTRCDCTSFFSKRFSADSLSVSSHCLSNCSMYKYGQSISRIYSSDFLAGFCHLAQLRFYLSRSTTNALLRWAVAYMRSMRTVHRAVSTPARTHSISGLKSQSPEITIFWEKLEMPAGLVTARQFCFEIYWSLETTGKIGKCSEFTSTFFYPLWKVSAWRMDF